jgi:acyl-CoA reductase-like NAD-dependent aldehyde dehydrogenase
MNIHSFINNQFYKSDIQFTKLNAYTSEALHTVHSCDLMGLVTAIQAANRAFAQFKTTSLSERRQLVEKIKTALLSRRDDYARLEALDQALPLSFVNKNSLDLVLKMIDTTLAEQPEEGLHYSPVGVVAIVASWNFSLRVIFERLIPALLAGNAVVIKISSASPVTAHILAEIIQAAAVPEGLINVIVTNDQDAKATLISHPGVRAVSFTGSIESTAEILPLISRSSLQNFKKIQISSGSKNSAVVLSEPHDNIFSGIMNSFTLGQGQLVWNSSRLFILEKFEHEWEEKIQSYLSDLKPSESIEDVSVWTPCLKKNSFDKFGEIQKTATEDQAKLLRGSYVLNDFQKTRFLPAVFTKDMSRCSTLQQDQIHAPFYILSTVKYPFDVAKYSNVSYFGFAAHLWGDTEKLAKIAETLDVGLVTYNKFSAEVDSRISAVKQSGFGLQDFRSFGAFYSNVKKMS